MSEPLSLAFGGAIVGVLFPKLLDKIADKATDATLAKLGKLKKAIVEKLKGKPKAKAELDKIEQGQEPNLDILAAYLKTEMLENDEFANEIETMVQEINKELEPELGTPNIMYVYGGKAYQQNQNQGEINNADTITINKGIK
ncbi:MAG: hypothetical protein AAGA60_22355 [Cyanobacteria bacterium P01_E01_bin.42]